MCVVRPTSSGISQRREVAETRDEIEPCIGAGPARPHEFGTRLSDETADNQADEDRIIGEPEHGDEVRNQVDRQGQIAQHQQESDAGRASERRVPTQPADQSDRIGQDPRRVTQRGAVRPEHDKADDEQQPQHHETADPAEMESTSSRVTLRT